MAPRTGFKTNQMRLAEAKEAEKAAQRSLIACSPSSAGLLNTLLRGVYGTSLGDLVGIPGITPWHLPGPLFKMGITAEHVSQAIDFGQKDTRGDIEGLKGLLGLNEGEGEEDNQEEEPLLPGLRMNPQIRPSGRTAAPATGAPTAQKPPARTGATLVEALAGFDSGAMVSAALTKLRLSYAHDQISREEFDAAKLALQTEAINFETSLVGFLTRVKDFESLCAEPLKYEVTERREGTG